MKFSSPTQLDPQNHLPLIWVQPQNDQWLAAPVTASRYIILYPLQASLFEVSEYLV